jgi:hypothetical protein
MMSRAFELARRVLGLRTMQPIDREALSTVHGGFLAALLSAAPAILQGVSGIISASKGGGGGGPPPQQTAAAAPPPQPAPAPAQPPAQPAPSPAAAACACCCDPLRSMASVSTMVRIG